MCVCVCVYTAWDRRLENFPTCVCVCVCACDTHSLAQEIGELFNLHAHTDTMGLV